MKLRKLELQAALVLYRVLPSHEKTPRCVVTLDTGKTAISFLNYLNP